MAVEEDPVTDSVGKDRLADGDCDAALLVLALAGVLAANGAAQILRVEEVDVIPAQAKTPSASRAIPTMRSSGERTSMVTPIDHRPSFHPGQSLIP